MPGHCKTRRRQLPATLESTPRPLSGMEPVYLSSFDLRFRYYWVGSTLAFEYHVDPARLQTSLQQLLRSWPTLGGRWLQTAQGRYYIGGGSLEIPYTATEKLNICLSDIPSRYAEHRVSDACPSNSLLPDFVPQLQPHLMLAGKEALFKVQLTQVQDGSVLGFSFCHGLSDLQGIGYALADLARLYQGQEVSNRSDNRFWLALEALRGNQQLSPTPVSEEDIIAKLPCYGAPPASYDECIASGHYDELSCSAKDRAAGEYHSVSVLHVPGTNIEKLRSQALAGAAAESVSWVSANDIMSAILWLTREVANGNNLEHGLEKPLMIVVDLRKNGPALDSVPAQFLGNAVGGSFCMPPHATTALQESDASCSTATPAQDCCNQLKMLPGEHYTSILLAAALAVRKGLEALRADPNSLQRLAAGTAMYATMPPEQLHKRLASPDFMPLRDAALLASSWRHMPTDHLDFGGGKAHSLLGSLMPASPRFVNITSGPEGDGLMCILRLPRDGVAKVQQSQLLNHIAPEAQLLVQ